MPPNKFTNLVAAYGLPLPWLAKHVGHTSERNFRYWVRGRPGHTVTVPEEAVQRMRQVNRALAGALRPMPAEAAKS